MRVEVLTDARMTLRGAAMLRAMMEASPFEIRARDSYVGDCEWLMVYGTGHPVRRPWLLRHIAGGRPAIGWDLGYWKHAENTMRMTVNADHPHAMIQPESPDRWDAEGIALREDADPAGPIVLIGVTEKAMRAHGLGPLDWESQRIKRLRKDYPDREIVFRSKRAADPRPPKIRVLKSGPIEEAIAGASLVVCRHSNVAVDACIAGVPVVCDDGAALALYRDNPNPSPSQRLDFLRSLAHWQYKPSEAATAWNYLRKRLSA